MKEKVERYAVIRVIEPVLQQPPIESIPPFVTYLVCGADPHGQFSIRRRFRQFLLLRNKLVQRFMGMYIPPISSKRAAGNTEERYVEMMRNFLHYFCQKIAERPYIFDSDIFQTFIRGNPDFQTATKAFPVHQYSLLSRIYEIQFQRHLQQHNNLPSILIMLQKEVDFLKYVDKTMSNIRQQILQVAEAKNHFTKDYSHVLKEVLPRYEREIIRIHDQSGENQFIGKNQICKAGLEEYLFFCQDNPLEDYAEMMNYDIREARALLEAIQSRRQLQTRKSNFERVRRDSKEELQRLKAGKTTLKSIFTSGKKDQQINQLQSNIVFYQQNESYIGLCLPLSAISIFRDIITYKTNRCVDYMAKIQIIARKQMKLLEYYGMFLNYGIDKKDN